MVWTEQQTFATANNAGEPDFSPGNTWIAAGAGGGQVDVWEFDTGNNVFTQGGYGTCNSVRFSPDSSLFSYSENSTDHIIHHVDTSTWTEWSNASFPTHNVYSAFDYSSDGNYFAHNYGGAVEVRSVGGDETWTVTDTFATNNNDKRAIAWNRAHGYILTGDRQGNYWVIDTSSWSLTDSGTITNSPDFYQIDAHPSNPWFIMADTAGYWNVTVVEIDTSTGALTELHQFSGGDGTDGASSVCITDGYLYITRQTAADDLIHLADNDTWAQEATISLLTTVWRSRFSRDGQWLAIGDRDADTIRVYDTAVSQTATVSGTFTVDGSAVSGANIIAINDTQGTFQTSTTTDTNGAYSIEFPSGEEGHFAGYYDDGTTIHKVLSKPFVVPE